MGQPKLLARGKLIGSRRLATVAFSRLQFFTLSVAVARTYLPGKRTASDLQATRAEPKIPDTRSYCTRTLKLYFPQRSRQLWGPAERDGDGDR